MPLLNYQEVIAITYTDDDSFPTMTPEQLSLCIQIVVLLNSPTNWGDYLEYSDDIDALVSGLTTALLEAI